MKKRYQRYALFLCITLNTSIAEASLGAVSTTQHTVEHVRDEQVIVLPFGATFEYPFNQGTHWSITELATNRTLTRGNGSIKNLVFEIPGTYVIDVTEEPNHNPETCNHPEYPEKITIEVSHLNMAFDFSTLRFSQEIVGGLPLDGQTLAVDVVFNAYGKEEVECQIQLFKSAGVGTTIIGTPMQERVILRPGVNTLIYRLSGQAQRGTYLMFDFLDVNNQVQVYNLSQPIN